MEEYVSVRVELAAHVIKVVGRMKTRHHTIPFDFEKAKWLTRDGNNTIRSWRLPRATAFSKTGFDNAGNGGKYPLDMLVAYEDSVARKHAIRLHGDLIAGLQDKHDFQSSWWRFSFLREPGMFNRAVEDAVNADMIVLAVHGDRDLPPIARNWIDRWKGLKDGNHCALVALVDELPLAECAGHVCAQTDYLDQVAKATQMTFFSKLFTAEKPKMLKAPETARRQFEPGIQLLLNELLNGKGLPESGGINE